MSVNTNENFPHFPEDKDSPVINSNSSSLKELHFRKKKFFDMLIFSFILFITILTISFSMYILLVKYII